VLGLTSSDTARLNVLVLNTDVPIFPGAAGHEFLMMTRLARLAQHVGVVSLVHTRQDFERSVALTDAGVRLYLWTSPWLDGAPPALVERRAIRSMHRVVQRLIEFARTRSERPADTLINDAAFSNMAPGLVRALAERQWHVVEIVQSSAAAMIDCIPRPLVTVLVMHDIRARLYERRAMAAPTPLARWLWKAEARRYRRFEGSFCQRFDLVVTVSAEDARWVREHYDPPRLFAAPIPVDTSYFSPSAIDNAQENCVVFTGHLSHPPNIDAAIYFARDVMPLVLAEVPSAEFHIVGRRPVESVRALSRLPSVRVFADVPDIRTHIAAAAVVVAPLRFGSGSRNKILEAWGMEKCVVATTVGAEGLDYRPETDIVLADGTRQLASAVSNALSRPDLRTRLGRAGRSVACREHNPALLTERYYAELARVCSEKATREVPMRLMLDMRWMVPGLAGGLETLARSFLRELAAIDGHNEYSVLLPSRSRYDFDLRHRSNFRIVSLDSAGGWIRRKWRGLKARIGHRLHLPDWRTPDVRDLQWLHDLGVEIAYSFPGYIHPQLFPLRQILVVPDIQHEYLPHFFSGDVLEERRRVYTDSIRRADQICAISEFTRQTLIQRLGVPPDRITTIPLAADEAFVWTGGTSDADRLTLERYDLVAGGYLFFPAHTWHHKNHKAAIEALRVLRNHHHIRQTLVCSGGAREAQPSIEEAVKAAGLESNVRFIGYVPAGDVPALYRGAACLVFPSLFEGFGMPVLEAMASGCPVVCSNTTSLPEIAGDAAILVDPTDPEAIAAALAGVLTDDDRRRHLVTRGLERATWFSWRRHTIETLVAFRKVHAQIRTL
jgi:glycosyltransferase involved in cell wall biosynthesis